MDEVNKEFFRYSHTILKTDNFLFADWMLKRLEYTENFFMIYNLLEYIKV